MAFISSQFHLCQILTQDFLPSVFTHRDYPYLVRANERVDTIAVLAALISYNWPSKTEPFRLLVDPILAPSGIPNRAASSQMAGGQSRCHFAWLDTIAPDGGRDPASLAGPPSLRRIYGLLATVPSEWGFPCRRLAPHRGNASNAAGGRSRV